MIWIKAANVLQMIGGTVAVCALLMGDNETISTEFIAQKMVLGCVILVVGLFWEEFCSNLQHIRRKKRIYRYRDKDKRKKEKERIGQPSNMHSSKKSILLLQKEGKKSNV